MTAAEVRTIAVVGAGLMGHGIALEFATAGYAVRLHDRGDEHLERARRTMAANLRLLGESGNLAPAEIGPALARIAFGTDLQMTVAEADIVVEAVFEDLALKQAIFRDLDAWAPKRAILASNTSSFMPSLLAAATRRPERVLVAHYFNPPYLLPLVELVPGPETAAATIATMRDLYLGIGKHPVVLRREAPGFVGNRLQTALLREALAIVAKGIASAEEVDTIIRTGFGRRLAVAGVFEVRDLSGWDVSLTVAELLFPELESSPEVPPLLRERAARRRPAEAAASLTSPDPDAARREQIRLDLAALARLLDG